MMSWGLVPATCHCGRATLPQETTVLPDPSLDQQHATELAEEFQVQGATLK